MNRIGLSAWKKQRLGTSSSATGPGAVQVAEAAPGVHVGSIRLDPPTPRRNQDIFSYVTFVNTTGAAQAVRWDELVYRPDNVRQYFAANRCPLAKENRSPREHTNYALGPYKLAGGGG